MSVVLSDEWIRKARDVGLLRLDADGLDRVQRFLVARKLEELEEAEESLEKLTAWWRFWHGFEDQVWSLFETTKSALEQLLGTHLLVTTDGYTRLMHYSDYLVTKPNRATVPWPFGYHSPWGPPEFGTVVACQGDVGTYRADFLFVAACSGHFARLVVECDGHDFHERTKEQAAHDRRRDRFMVAEGITVLRFTGSEIWRAPETCAEEISRQLFRLMTPLIQAHLAEDRTAAAESAS